MFKGWSSVPLHKQFKIQFRHPKTSKQDQVQSTHGPTGIVSRRSPGGKKKQNNHLVGGFNQPNMENCDVSQNGNLNPPQNFRDENSKKYVSCHHLAMKNIQHLCDKGAQITQKQGSRSCMNVSDMISGWMEWWLPHFSCEVKGRHEVTFFLLPKWI